ncbi:MAG TPA: hypothetical protein EYN79_01340 [Planctomycetes bacterium]|nr:hypothetical protein [Planctomycetota bacterium]HIN79662.1 hypothetical protein [Planctomycetota bacterium]
MNKTGSVSPATFPEPSLGSWLEVAFQMMRALLGIAFQAFHLVIFPFQRDRVAREMETRICRRPSMGESTLEKRN